MSYAKMCLECKRICDEEELYRRPDAERDEFWGEPVFRPVTYECCPFCGYDQLIDVHLCERCDLNETKTDDDWCEQCLGKHVKSLEPLDQWMTEFRDELNGMVPR